MNLLRYCAESSLLPLAHKAARAWNRALENAAYLYPAPLTHADIIISFGAVDRSKDASRVAECETRQLTKIIRLASDVKWRISWLSRMTGIGGQEDALAALLHEFGHALGLPHSDIYSDVMHPELGSTVISADEAARARALLKL